MRHSAPPAPRGYSDLEQRWFAALLVYTLAPLIAVAAWAPPGISFWWDFGMAVGICAATALALLPLISARWWAPAHPESVFLRLVQIMHRDLSYAAVVLVALHVLILLALEPRVIEYLKLGAVAPMLAGLVASLVFVALIVTSLYRARWGWGYRGWRRWHAVLSAFALTLTAWHLVGAGFYFGTPGATGGLLLVFGVPTTLTLSLRRWPMAPRMVGVRRPEPDPRCARPQRLLAAVVLTWLAGSALYASGRSDAPPLRPGSPCRIEPCL